MDETIDAITWAKQVWANSKQDKFTLVPKGLTGKIYDQLRIEDTKGVVFAFGQYMKVLF